MDGLFTAVFWLLLGAAVIAIFAVDDEGLRWLISAPLLALGVLAILGNWLIVLNYYVRGQHASLFPLLGGVLTAIAIARIPLASWNGWWWIPPTIDPGVWVIATTSASEIRAKLGRRKNSDL